MAQDKIFDATAYFTALATRNKLARTEGFVPVTSSGIDELEGIIDGLRTHKAFVCIDDTGETAYRQESGGWFARRVWTVHILHRHKPGDMDDRARWLDVCRRVFRQLMSAIIADRYLGTTEGIWYVDLTQVLSREYPQQFIDGLTGLYFTLAADEPLDMTINNDEWDDGND